MNDPFIRTTLGCLWIVAMTACGSVDDANDDGTEFEPEVEGIALEPSPEGSTPEMEPAAEGPSDGETTKACETRDDLVSFVTPRAGSWGDWAPCYSYCAPNAFAYEAQLQSEANQGGGGDDTAANGLAFHCFDRTTGANKGWVWSSQGPWGTWGSIASANPLHTGNPWIGVQAWWERPQGSGDDTQFNKAGMHTKLGGHAGSPVFPGFAVDFSTNVNSGFCPSGAAICGIRTRVEAPQVGDDSALNGISFACCTF